MTIHEYFQIHDNTYMRLKSLIHEIHNTCKFNTWRMSVQNVEVFGNLLKKLARFGLVLVVNSLTVEQIRGWINHLT